MISIHQQTPLPTLFILNPDIIIVFSFYVKMRTECFHQLTGPVRTAGRTCGFSVIILQGYNGKIQNQTQLILKYANDNIVSLVRVDFSSCKRKSSRRRKQSSPFLLPKLLGSWKLHRNIFVFFCSSNMPYPFIYWERQGFLRNLFSFRELFSMSFHQSYFNIE